MSLPPGMDVHYVERAYDKIRETRALLVGRLARGETDYGFLESIEEHMANLEAILAEEYGEDV